MKKGEEHLVRKLKKSLYGLKQVPQEWYHKFDAFIRSQGLKRSETNPCLCTKMAKDNSLILLVLYKYHICGFAIYLPKLLHINIQTKV